MKGLTLLFLLMLISGCTASYVDVSHEEKYESLINSEYETLSEFIIHGVTLDWGANKDVIDLYLVTEPPGSGNRYTLKRITLPIGSVFTIRKVLYCMVCFGDINFEIELQSELVESSIPVRMYNYSSYDKSTDYVIMNKESFLKKE